jgi:hypothetical protein
MVPALSDTHGSFDTFDRKLKVVAPDAEYRESGRVSHLADVDIALVSRHLRV